MGGFQAPQYSNPSAPLNLTKDLDIDDKLKDKIQEMEERIKALRDDANYDKLKKYWETVIRHRQQHAPTEHGDGCVRRRVTQAGLREARALIADHVVLIIASTWNDAAPVEGVG